MKFAYAGGRWRNERGRFASARSVARQERAPPRTVRVAEREPHKYVRVTVNERIRVPDRYGGRDRMVEVHVSRTLKQPSRKQEARARREVRAEVARAVAKATKRKKLGRAVSRVVGVETAVVRRKERNV